MAYISDGYIQDQLGEIVPGVVFIEEDEWYCYFSTGITQYRVCRVTARIEERTFDLSNSTGFTAWNENGKTLFSN